MSNKGALVNRMVGVTGSRKDGMYLLSLLYHHVNSYTRQRDPSWDGRFCAEIREREEVFLFFHQGHVSAEVYWTNTMRWGSFTGKKRLCFFKYDANDVILLNLTNICSQPWITITPQYHLWLWPTLDRDGPDTRAVRVCAWHHWRIRSVNSIGMLSLGSFYCADSI